MVCFSSVEIISQGITNNVKFCCFFTSFLKRVQYSQGVFYALWKHGGANAFNSATTCDVRESLLLHGDTFNSATTWDIREIIVTW